LPHRDVPDQLFIGLGQVPGPLLNLFLQFPIAFGRECAQDSGGKPCCQQAARRAKLLIWLACPYSAGGVLEIADSVLGSPFYLVDLAI
jgi:hypothetical protein